AAVADPRDKLKGYLLASTSLDGTLATHIMFTQVRVVCWNTMTFAIGQSAKANAESAKNGERVRIKHRSVVNWGGMNEKLGITVREQFKETMDLFKILAETRIT